MLKTPVANIFVLTIFYLAVCSCNISKGHSATAFGWPDGKKTALSLSFDDARLSQVDLGTKLFDKYGAKVTFHVVSERMQPRLEDWKQAVESRHEIGSGETQTTRTSMLEKVIEYTQDSENQIWLATVGEIAGYVKDSGFSQSDAEIIQNKKTLEESLTFYASFDGQYDADFAKGDDRIFTAPAHDKLEEAKPGMKSDNIAIAQGKGKFNDALDFRKKAQTRLFYTSEQNVAYDKEDWSGTISLWLSLNPEQDLEPGFTDPIQITDVGYNDAALWVDFTNKNPRDFRMGIFGDLEVWNPNNVKPNENPDFLNRLVTAGDRPFGKGKWTHVVISYANLNSSNARAEFYVNGELQGSSKHIPEPFTWDLSKSKIFIGLNFVGLMDEVALFDKALNAVEVSFLYELANGVRSILPQNGY